MTSFQHPLSGIPWEGQLLLPNHNTEAVRDGINSQLSITVERLQNQTVSNIFGYINRFWEVSRVTKSYLQRYLKDQNHQNKDNLTMQSYGKLILAESIFRTVTHLINDYSPLCFTVEEKEVLEELTLEADFLMMLVTSDFLKTGGNPAIPKYFIALQRLY